MEPAQVEERIRCANDIGKAPENPANRITITLQPPPHDEQFPDKGIVKVIGHNCMDGWPDSAVTWAEASQLQKTRAWEDFQKRFTWDASIDVKVKEIYARKCAERTKGMFHTARTTAHKDAEKAHPGQAQEHIQDFPPWWCDRTLWAEMCQKWSGEKWTKKSKTASTNRASGTLDGVHAPATYRGGTKSQVQYMKEEQTRSEGAPPRRWTEVYESLRTNLPGANEPCTRYDQMMAEKYPDASTRPDFDEGLWYTASGGKKKGYVKGLDFKRSRPSNFTTCTTASSSAGASTATSCAPTSQQAAQEMVTTLCADRNLLQQLQQALLSAMSTADIGRHLADREQLQGSANTESSMPPPPPPPPRGAEGN